MKTAPDRFIDGPKRWFMIAYDEEFESVGIFYNDGDQLISSIDFWGNSNAGKLSRVETVNAAAYWCVWVNFFSETDLNRESMVDSLRVVNA